MNELTRNIEKHLQEICLVPSRHVGSPGVKAAADYIEKSFRELGYTDVKQEPFPTTNWDYRGMVFADLDNASSDVPGALPCFFSQSCNVSGVPVWLTDKDLANLDNIDVKDKLCVVEFFSEAADIKGRNGIADELDRRGAAAAVFISDATYHTTCAASTKIQRSPNLKTLAAAVVSEEGAYYLARNRHHRYKLFIDAKAYPGSSYNVAAIRPGSGNKRIIFGSHHDGAPIGQAACDNASGVACVIELARLLKDKYPEWTLEFASFDAEEYCITPGFPAGSEAYVRDHADRQWDFFMNFDSVGIAWAEEVIHIGRKELLKEFKTSYPVLPIKMAGDDRNFDKLGIPTFWFNSHAKFKDFHTPLDTISTLDMAKIAQSVNEAINILDQLYNA